MKIAINRCFGGFGLSWAAVQAIAARKGLVASWFIGDGFKRRDRDPDDLFATRYIGPRAVSSWNDLGDRPEEDGFINPSWIARDDADLVAVVESLGDAASGAFAKLEVVEIPDGVLWEIDDYDGQESIHEQHRSW